MNATENPTDNPSKTDARPRTNQRISTDSIGYIIRSVGRISGRQLFYYHSLYLLREYPVLNEPSQSISSFEDFNRATHNCLNIQCSAHWTHETQTGRQVDLRNTEPSRFSPAREAMTTNYSGPSSVQRASGPCCVTGCLPPTITHTTTVG